MLNIAIDIRPLMSANRTGVSEYIYELLNALFKIDRQNQYFLFYNSSSKISHNIPQWKYDNVNYIHNKWPNKLFNSCQKFLKYPKIDRLIIKKINKKTNKQINTLNYFFSPNLNFTTLSKNIKYILTIHDLSFELYPQYYSTKRRLWHWAIDARKQCQRADIILTPSNNTKHDLNNIFKINNKKINTIYPGFNLNTDKTLNKQKIKQKYNLPNNFILFLSTIEPRKNIIGLIKAFEQFQANSSWPYYLIIAGAKGWKNKKIYKIAKKSKYKENIKFIGYIDHQDKPLLYSLAQVFVYPSFYEGFGFPILEAMACKVPVVTSNRSSLTEVSNHAAYSVSPHKIKDISEAIKNLIENKQLREYYIVKGLNNIEKYSWTDTAQKLLNKL